MFSQDYQFSLNSPSIEEKKGYRKQSIAKISARYKAVQRCTMLKQE